MSRRYLLTDVLAIYFCLTALLTGCATTRYISNPTTPPQDLGLVGSTDDLEIKLHYVIVPDGPGSWIQGAKWNEWVLSIKNLTQSDVTVEKISLIDPRGVYVRSEYGSVDELESAAERAQTHYASLYGSTAVGSALVGAAMPLMAAGIPIGPIGALPYFLLSSSQAQGRDAVQAEFQKRRLPLPLELSSGGSLRGGVFLPLVPQPQALVVTYRKGRSETESQIKMRLDKISNLQAAQQP